MNNSYKLTFLIQYGNIYTYIIHANIYYIKTEANLIIMDIKSDAFYLELTESGNIIHKICWADSFFMLRE